MTPTFELGDPVRVLRTIRNDGSYPGASRGAVLIRRGAVGHIVSIGTFLQDQTIYAVHFLAEGRVVGCRDTEVQPPDAPYTDSPIDRGDTVIARRPLAHAGVTLVAAGTAGRVISVDRADPDAVTCDVLFPGFEPVTVPDHALSL